MATLQAYNEYLSKHIIHKDGYYYIEGYSDKYNTKEEAQKMYVAMDKLSY